MMKISLMAVESGQVENPGEKLPYVWLLVIAGQRRQQWSAVLPICLLVDSVCVCVCCPSSR